MDSGRRWSMGVRFGQFRLERDFADRLGGTRPRPHDIRLTTNASTPKPHRTMEPVRAASTPQITPRPRFDQVARLNRPRAKRSCSGSLPRNTKLILPIRISSSACSRTAGSTRAGPVHMSGRQRYQRLSRLLLRATSGHEPASRLRCEIAARGHNQPRRTDREWMRCSVQRTTCFSARSFIPTVLRLPPFPCYAGAMVMPSLR